VILLGDGDVIGMKTMHERCSRLGCRQLSLCVFQLGICHLQLRLGITIVMELDMYNKYM
jgi:hypothetical protein